MTTTRIKDRFLDWLLSNGITVLIIAAAIIYSNGIKDTKIDILVEDSKKNLADHAEIKKDLTDTKEEVIKIAKDIEYLKKDGLVITVDKTKDITKD